ncbi:hypothetical protein KFZ67_08015 [Photobacterium damselae]|uniref:hypothetical protein n=1 Tax=Photobacterium damselae TaxID=38293 RepID=UPI002542C50B
MAKWLIYTVVVGLIPILSRLFSWLVTKDNIIPAFSASDFIAFGLVLHISIINEVEHINDLDKSWKTFQNGISISFIAFYSVLYTFTLLAPLSDVTDPAVITNCAQVLSVVSFLISFSVFDRVSKLHSASEVVA